MTVAFFEPPAPLRVGGLDLAIRTLERDLARKGSSVLLHPELSAVRPDVLHFHGLWQRPFLKAARWARKNSVPYVVSPHGMLEPWAFEHKGWKKKPYFYALERPLLRRAACLLATGEQEAANIRRYTGHPNATVIPLALSSDTAPDYQGARTRLGWKEHETVAVFLSRIHPKKGLPMLFEALSDLGPEAAARNLRLVIVGDGDASYIAELRKDAARLSCTVSVEWTGPVWGDEKWRYLQGADLFCLPTYSENFGIAVQEACQVGTPVLTTDTTPWGFLNSWKAGFVVSPDAERIKAALREFLTSFTWTDADRQALARRTRERFDPDGVTQRYLDLYEAL